MRETSFSGRNTRNDRSIRKSKFSVCCAVIFIILKQNMTAVAAGAPLGARTRKRLPAPGTVRHSAGGTCRTKEAERNCGPKAALQLPRFSLTGNRQLGCGASFSALALFSSPRGIVPTYDLVYTPLSALRCQFFFLFALPEAEPSYNQRRRRVNWQCYFLRDRPD